MNIPLHQFLPAARAQVRTEIPAVAALGSGMEGHQPSHCHFQTAPAQTLNVTFTFQMYLPLHFLSIAHAMFKQSYCLFSFGPEFEQVWLQR